MTQEVGPHESSASVLRAGAARILLLDELDRRQEALDTLSQARELGQRTRAYDELALVNAAAAVLQYSAGAWDAALAEVAALQEFLPPYGTPPAAWLPWQAYGLAALISALRGQEETADALLAQVPEPERAVDADVRGQAGFALAARAARAEQAGRSDEALDLLTESLSLDSAHVVELGQKTSWLPQLARLALEAGRRDLLEAAALAAESEASDSAARRALAQFCRGLVERDADMLGAAARYYRSANRRLELGRVEEELAALFAASGDPVNARRHLAQALGAYVTLGARAEARRVEARLRRSGVSVGSRATAPARSQLGWSSLTPLEVKVAEAVAEGMSNPEIGRALLLTQRTVQVHVAHILFKLGIGSRSLIVREVAFHSGTDGRSVDRG